MSNRIPCRIEELPFVASALRHTLERDKADFKSFFPKKFPDNMLEILDGKITPVENVIKTEIPTREIKKVTGQILAESMGFNVLKLFLYWKAYCLNRCPPKSKLVALADFCRIR